MFLLVDGMHCHARSHVCTCLQELARRTAAGKPLYPLTSLQGTPYAHCDGRVPCRFFHPGQTCSQHAMSIFPHNYERALRVYLPVYLLPMLLVHRQRLLKEPLPILNKAALGVARCGHSGHMRIYCNVWSSQGAYESRWHPLSWRDRLAHALVLYA